MRLTLIAAALMSTAVQASTGTFLLNEVTADQLTQIEGVDAQQAGKIVELREKRKRLGSVEELRILGLDNSTMNVLRGALSQELSIKKVAKGSYTSVDQVLAQFAHEPDVLKVQAMAMDYTKTNPALVEGWLKASKAAYALPAVTLTYVRSMR